MKIAVWHNLNSGGAKRALQMHVQGLARRGHKIHAFSTNIADHDYLPLSPHAIEDVLLLPSEPKRQGLKKFLPDWLRSKEAEYRIGQLNRMLIHGRQCGEEIRKGGFDVLFANSCTLTYNTCIGSYVDIPSLIYLQEPYRPFYEAGPRLPWLLPQVATRHPRNPFKRAAERCRDLHRNHWIRLQASEELRWARSYNRILCNSQFSRESILRAYNLDSKVCYLGIDSSDFNISDGEKQSYVVSVGGLHYGKRVERALHAIAVIPQNLRPPLKWIGNIADPDYVSAMHGLAADLGVDFQHIVRASDQELQLILGRAACFLYTPFLEPFGLAPLEANACGTAVVAIAEGGVKETIVPGVNGLLANDSDPEALAELILRFTLDLGEAKRMGIQARQHVMATWPVEPAIDRIEHHLLQVSNR